MANGDATPVFTDEDVRLIFESLPDSVDPRRRELLPRILHEWSRNELREHLSRESPAIIRKRAKRVEMVGDCARSLLQAFDALDDHDRAAIAAHTPRRGGRLWPKMMGHPLRESSEIVGLILRIKDENAFLTGLVAAAPAAWKRRRGHPRNITAYLVIKDAAAIFEWLTEMEATREVDRDSGKETGPFWQFAATIWPMVFGKSKGLSAGMKNWASYRKKYREGCALIANIAFRHPEWRLFDD